MGSAVPDAAVAMAIDGIDARLDLLQGDDWTPVDADEALVRVREVEAISRRLHAVQLGLQDRIGRSGIHRADGHASAKVMVRHGANLSNAEALRREKVVRMQRDLPVVAAGHAAGTIGTPQAERIARAHGIERIREQLIAHDANVARAATVLPYPLFDAALTDWVRLTDEEGSEQQAERNHADRDLRIHPNLDGSHRIEGGGGSLDGQIVEDIWSRQVQREWEADWADARGRCGDAATAADLARTEGQRRYDAFKALMIRGDITESDLAGTGARTCTELVIDEVTFERHVAKLFGTDPGPDPRLATWWDDLLDPEDATADDVPDPDPDPSANPEPDLEPEPDAACTSDSEREPGVPSDTTGGDLVGYRCGTVDGRPLDPTEVVVATLIGQVRRVVVRADGVVLDMGRKARCFTGARQLAVRLAHASCVWPACEVPSSRCQCDHLDAFNGPRHGSTNPGNGAPACGRHNRLKEHGFTIVRDQRGRWHVYRPDGTEIT